MKKKSTDDLMRDLACAPSFDAYSRRNTASFSDSRMAELLSTRDLDPARRERDREDHDERGTMIRAMARARPGDVLLWLLLFGAAYLYFFGVPKWVSLILLTLACVKLLLDWMFTVWYRRQY